MAARYHGCLHDTVIPDTATHPLREGAVGAFFKIARKKSAEIVFFRFFRDTIYMGGCPNAADCMAAVVAKMSCAGTPRKHQEWLRYYLMRLPKFPACYDAVNIFPVVVSSKK